MGEILTWLMEPLSGADVHIILPEISWHGRLMVLAWGIFVPLGILVARYFKVTPWQNWPQTLDNKFWWNWHRGLHYSAVTLSIMGVWLVISAATGRGDAAKFHAILGWAVIVAGLAQILAGWMRGTKGGPTGERAHEGNFRGDHYDMTHRRILFEYFHKFVGITALAIALLTICLGLYAADAPRWMPVLLILWWGGLTVLAILLQKRGYCVDTYQAIWGFDADHPGNDRKPIGFGIRVHPLTVAEKEAFSALKDKNHD